jgi:hypothetical protein
MDNATISKKLAKKHNIDIRLITSILPHATSEIIKEMKGFNNLIIDVHGLFRWYYKRTGKCGINTFKDYCWNKLDNHLTNHSPLVMDEYGLNKELTIEEFHLFMEHLDKLFIKYEEFTNEKIKKRAEKLVYKKQLEHEYQEFIKMANQ